MEKRTKPVETPEQALHRLAELAETRGIAIYVYPQTGEHYATSSSSPGLLHRVTLISCDCPGFYRNQRCTHHARLLDHLDELPPLPTPPSSEPQTITPAGTVSAQSARHIEAQARAWLESLITRQDRGDYVPEADVWEATRAVALYASLNGDGLPIQVAA